MKHTLHILLFFLLISLLFNSCQSTNEAEPGTSGLFMKLIGGAENDESKDFFIADNGDIIGTGTTQSFSPNPLTDKNIFLFRTNSKGNTIWQNGLGGTEGSSIIPLENGEYAIIGSFKNPSNQIYELHFMVVNNQGGVKNEAKIRPIGDNTSEVKGISIAKTSDGNFLLLGEITIGNQESYIYLVKVTPTGVRQSEKIYGFNKQFNNINAMRLLANDDAIIVGTSNNNQNSGARLTMVDNNINIKWDYNYSPTITDENLLSKDVQIANAGFIMAGVSFISNTKIQGLLIKTNSNGILTWKKEINVGSNLIINSVFPTQDGGYILTGDITMSDKEIPHTNIWVGKTNANGELEWHKNFGGKRNDTGTCVRTNKEGNFVIVGTLGFETNQMLILIEINKNGDIIR
ncbi:MAG: hypothetical protein EAZ44_08955 [Cytophagia bacterium]|nr:MAG: hypothetical protein EAZ44_08955 [Cytophagia bacterium]TAG37919.1 MAG: hypothetical protein EAZ31_11005 [Cytophagia bacterium]